ncbi:MAG: hypothetical protein ACLPSH_12695 [Vulcanimicrobiaceae bacterium]
MMKRNLVSHTLFGRTLAATAIGVALGVPLGALAGKSAGYEGTVVHISTDNIEVKGSDGETLSFLIVPRFRKVLHADGKTTARTNEIRSGDRVRVVYDQGALGARHADEIVDETAPYKPLKS